jgi:hypothetical protein
VLISKKLIFFVANVYTYIGLCVAIPFNNYFLVCVEYVQNRVCMNMDVGICMKIIDIV